MSALQDADRERRNDLRQWRSQFNDCTAIADAGLRSRCTCVGVVRLVRLNPGRGIDVTVEDGSGRLTATFTGRSRLPGLQMGAGLRLCGTITDDGQGKRTMRNPDWSLVTEPDC